MKHIPTSDQLAELERNVAEHGFTPYEDTIQDILEHARLAGAWDRIIDPLDDEDAPEFLRAKALILLAQDWPFYERRLHDLARKDEPQTVELLDAWRNHLDLRKQKAPADQLWSSRRRLDAVRFSLRHTA